MITRWFAALLLGVFFMLPTTAVRAQESVDCQSRNYSYVRCDADWRDARIVRQLSDTRCIKGQNWGIDRRGLWVDRGCGGTFVEAGRGHRDRDGDDYGRGGGGGWRPGPDWDNRFAINCGSEDYRYTFCSVDVGRRGKAFLERQTSKSACIEGRTWGWNRAGIWVNEGCGGVFTIDRRW